VINAFTEVLAFSPVNDASGGGLHENALPCRSYLPLLPPLERYTALRHFGEARQ
jgi:hypothetical protein